MTFKSEYKKYCKAYKAVEDSGKKLSNFFSDFDLEYSITHHASDGVMLLDYESSLCANLSEDDVNDLSKAKTKEAVMLVINRLNFNC